MALDSVTRGTDKLKEACGVFGIYAPGEDLFQVVKYALFALQHVARERLGIR